MKLHMDRDTLFHVVVSVGFGVAGFLTNLLDIQLFETAGLRVTLLVGLAFPLTIALAWGWKLASLWG